MFFNKSKKLLKEREIELAEAKDQIAKYQLEFRDVISKDELLNDRIQKIEIAEQKLKDLNEIYQKGLVLHSTLEKEVLLYKDSLEIGSFGLYEPQFSFETSDKFKEELLRNYEKQKQMIKDDSAVICKTEWTVGGSKAEGRKMTNQYKKLMLFAFNGECDGLIAKVKWNNAAKTIEKIKKSFESVNKLGVTQNVYISSNFLALKLEELALAYEYEQKKYEEKEEQRRIREQMRDEEKAQRELERAQRDAEDEEKRVQKAIDKANQELKNASESNSAELLEQIKMLELKLQEAHEKKERAIALAQLTKVGHIYVISNIGSFGENVYKIGMTRSLDPLDRVRELGDASVPFQFDVHAIIYSENAPQLENELHRKFGDRRLNRVNSKKEFFKVTLDEIEAFVNQNANAEIEFTKLAEAREYRETLQFIEQLSETIDEVEQESTFPESIF